MIRCSSCSPRLDFLIGLVKDTAIWLTRISLHFTQNKNNGGAKQTEIDEKNRQQYLYRQNMVVD